MPLTYKRLLLLPLLLLLLGLLLNRCLKAAARKWHMWLNQLIVGRRLTVRSSLRSYTSWLPLPMRCVLPVPLVYATACAAAAAVDSAGWPEWLQGLQQRVRATHKIYSSVSNVSLAAHAGLRSTNWNSHTLRAPTCSNMMGALEGLN
jgi:uncharacterized membrane protein